MGARRDLPRLTTMEYVKLRTQNRRFLLRCTGFHRKMVSYRVLWYESALIATKGESVEASIRRWALRFAGFLVRLDDNRLPKGAMSR